MQTYTVGREIHLSTCIKIHDQQYIEIVKPYVFVIVTDGDFELFTHLCPLQYFLSV